VHFIATLPENGMQNLISKASIEINASPDRIWKALTTPSEIKQYLFGTETSTDWKVGSPISWRGNWEGKAYEDKGRIITAEPGKLLRYTYWSSMQGKLDKPENYATVTNEIFVKDGKALLTITQDGNENEESREHSEQNWRKVLEGIKKIAEGR
jgi:uncharacterized protein YndB with AHSA1/START domain